MFFFDGDFEGASITREEKHHDLTIRTKDEKTHIIENKSNISLPQFTQFTTCPFYQHKCRSGCSGIYVVYFFQPAVSYAAHGVGLSADSQIKHFISYAPLSASVMSRLLNVSLFSPAFSSASFFCVSINLPSLS